MLTLTMGSETHEEPEHKYQAILRNSSGRCLRTGKVHADVEFAKAEAMAFLRWPHVKPADRATVETTAGTTVWEAE